MASVRFWPLIFVVPEYRGSCFLAAGWRCVGETTAHPPPALCLLTARCRSCRRPGSDEAAAAHVALHQRSAPQMTLNVEAPRVHWCRFQWPLPVHQGSPGTLFRVFEQSCPVAPSGGALPACGAGSWSEICGQGEDRRRGGVVGALAPRPVRRRSAGRIDPCRPYSCAGAACNAREAHSPRFSPRDRP